MRVLLTHACQYAGPGAASALLRDGHELLCHDASLTDSSALEAFRADRPGAIALTAQSAEALASEVGQVDAVVHNDVHPNRPMPVEEIPLQDFQASFEALYLFPVRLTQLLLPAMKARGGGRFVFVTSARAMQPEPGFALATSIRAATSAFAQAVAREAAPFAIQVNAVAPNYLYSEAYYPRARFVDDPQGRAEIAAKVPIGRLGSPEEIGELIAFLVSGRSSFLTGQVIPFTGGWP